MKIHRLGENNPAAAGPETAEAARRWKVLFRIAPLLVILAGCHPRGPIALEEARAALGAAWESCAAEYATERFREARREVEALEARMASGEGAAPEAAIRLARQAEQEARRQVTVARAGARHAIEEAEEALAKARAAGRAPGGVEVTVAEDRLAEARRVLAASPCNYRKARALALEAISLASNADTETVAALHR